jgi:hypothetical protein
VSHAPEIDCKAQEKKTEKPVFILTPNFNTFTFLKVQHVFIKSFDGNFK